MAKLSVSVPNDVVNDLRGLATKNVSAFVTTTIRHEIDRRCLFAFVDELDDELGPAGEDEIADFVEAFTSPVPAKPAGRHRTGTRAQRSAS